MSAMRRYSPLTVIFLLVCWNTCAEAQLTKLRVGYSAISEVDMPAWVAKETKLFEKNGLDVQLIYFTGGTTAVLALVSGEVPISQVAGPAVVNAALAGSDVVMSNFGAASDFIARYALEKIGLTPGKDVSIVQAGGISDRLAAVLVGRVQATVLNPPASFIGQKKGLNVLADVAKLGLAFQNTGVATSRRFRREQPDIVRRYIRAQVEAVHRIYTDKETALQILTKYFRGNVERDILEKTWELLTEGTLLPKKQYPTLEGLKFILAPLAEKDAKAKAAKPEDFADSRLIKELDESGYIDNLYKKR